MIPLLSLLHVHRCVASLIVLDTVLDYCEGLKEAVLMCNE